MNRLRIALATLLALTLLTELGGGTVSAGASRGQRRWSEKIQAGSSVTYNIEFVGGKTAEFAIIGNSDTDVDILVYDKSGNRIAQDVGLSDLGLVRWTPGSTQTYRIEVKNLGNTWNMVRMGHN
jgi:hypothetical protein